MANLLPDHLKGNPHLDAFEALFKQRLDAIEIDAVLMYLIDTVSISALPYMADQFGVSGTRGWKLASTDEQRREIIKNSIEFQRHLGTIWAVEEALKATGFPDAEIIEHYTPLVTGGWATFAVRIPLPAPAAISDTQTADLIALVEAYKNKRSHLVAVFYELGGFQDTVPHPSDAIDVTYAIGDRVDVSGFKYDGAHKYDGSQKYKPGHESFAVAIVP